MTVDDAYELVLALARRAADEHANDAATYQQWLTAIERIDIEANHALVPDLG